MMLILHSKLQDLKDTLLIHNMWLCFSTRRSETAGRSSVVGSHRKIDKTEVASTLSTSRDARFVKFHRVPPAKHRPLDIYKGTV